MKRHSLYATLIAALALGLACGGGETAQMLADEEATIELAQKNSFKYCFINGEQICFSPDSLLIIEMPRNLEKEPGQLQVTDRIKLLNAGYETVTIEQYNIEVIDDSSRTLEPTFTGPNGYRNDSNWAPAVVLDPNDEADIDFSINLYDQEQQVKAVTFLYRLQGDLGPRQVVVSYKPTNYLDIQPPAPGE